MSLKLCTSAHCGYRCGCLSVWLFVGVYFNCRDDFICEIRRKYGLPFFWKRKPLFQQWWWVFGLCGCVLSQWGFPMSKLAILKIFSFLWWFDEWWFNNFDSHKSTELEFPFGLWSIFDRIYICLLKKYWIQEHPLILTEITASML